MEVADEIIVINDGVVRQSGSPDDLYDHPQDEFVMEFLGPVTRLGGHLIRPHDIEVLDHAADSAVEAEISRVSRIGFEVRIDARQRGDRGTDPVSVQLTRGQAEHLGLVEGGTVWLRPAHGASTIRPTAVV